MLLQIEIEGTRIHAVAVNKVFPSYKNWQKTQPIFKLNHMNSQHTPDIIKWGEGFGKRLGKTMLMFLDAGLLFGASYTQYQGCIKVV